MKEFTIKDLENLSGIKAHTIRIWEQRYSFLKPKRTETNIRFYSNHELKTLLNIALLTRFGYKISHIDKMNEAELEKHILSLSTAEAQQERVVNDLIQSMITLDIEKFENIIDNYIISKGTDKTILQVIFPFLDRIGILWLTNHINPGQEHLVTNIIRQKLIVGIEGVSSHISRNKKIMLFLPEREYHEIGLLYANYLFKRHGIKVYYLGADVPLKDIAMLCEHLKPDYLYTHLTCVTGNFQLEKYLSQFQSLIPKIPLVISGRLCQKYKSKTPSMVQIKKSLPEMLEFVSNL
ncbi:MAG: MerR family transcriptional regulator [Bacteroidetes bacterium]|nr:MerR family transcriptional regulator [Bacteroidota bacterium]